MIGKNIYQKYLGHLLGDVNWAAAIIFYLLFIVGIFIFCILPAVEKDSFTHALLYGALFGFFTYATYDLTNLATLEGWPASIVPVDVAWGTGFVAAVSYAGYRVLAWLG